MTRRRRPAVLAQLLSGQQSLFYAPRSAPAFDELCPPAETEQLELEVDAAIRARNQTTIDDHTPRDA